MATVEAHYEQVLAEVYAWMLGGMEAGLERNRAFFRRHGVSPAGSGVAVDLGAGCGFQSIPLAELGYSVVAIDLSEKLLAELAEHKGRHDIDLVRDDLTNFRAHVPARIELAVCMLDTLLHLESRADVQRLFRGVFEVLEGAGRFVLTFRDLSNELTGLDRFIPVRSDDDMLLTCFLEYGPEAVTVHDLVYRKIDGSWQLGKSAYRKLRLPPDWVSAELSAAGFPEVEVNDDRGFVTVQARKP